jgi:hypothetical protein
MNICIPLKIVCPLSLSISTLREGSSIDNIPNALSNSPCWDDLSGSTANENTAGGIVRPSST